MRYIIIATHAHLAEGFIDAVKLIAGEQKANQIIPFCMTMGKEPEAFIEEEKDFLKDKNEDDEYIIFCDLYGASPCNSSLMAFRFTNYRVITGVNLGVLLEALYLLDTGTIDEIVDQLIQTGKEGVKKVYLQ